MGLYWLVVTLICWGAWTQAEEAQRTNWRELSLENKQTVEVFLPRGCHSSLASDRLTIGCGRSKVTVNEVGLPLRTSVLAGDEFSYLVVEQQAIRGNRSELLAIKKKGPPHVALLKSGGYFSFYQRASEVMVIHYQSCGCADACWIAEGYRVDAGKIHSLKEISCDCSEECNEPYMKDKLGEIRRRLLPQG